MSTTVKAHIKKVYKSLPFSMLGSAMLSPFSNVVSTNSNFATDRSNLRNDVRVLKNDQKKSIQDILNESTKRAAISE